MVCVHDVVRERGRGLRLGAVCFAYVAQQLLPRDIQSGCIVSCLGPSVACGSVSLVVAFNVAIFDAQGRLLKVILEQKCAAPMSHTSMRLPSSGLDNLSLLKGFKRMHRHCFCLGARCSSRLQHEPAACPAPGGCNAP